MRGGFRIHTPYQLDLSDDELIEQTRAFRAAFNRYYRLRPNAEAARRYAIRQSRLKETSESISRWPWDAA